jgi:hypothetical protein
VKSGDTLLGTDTGSIDLRHALHSLTLSLADKERRMEGDDETRRLLREIRDAQREQLAEYRRVTERSLELQQRAVTRQEQIGHLYRRLMLVGGVLVAALLVLLVYLLAKWSRYLFAIVVVSVALCSSAGAQDARAPEAAPLITILEAAKASDLAAFKSAYSRRIRDDQDQADWPKNLDEARTNLTRMFGDYRLADFGFAFAGGSERGRVALSHQGTPQFDLAVVKEDGRWKLDER